MASFFKDINARKRDGGELDDASWRRFVAALTARALPDYQAAALLMAVYLRGMTARETAALTAAMADSGERLAFGPGPYVDKHSTGGVGDAVTLVAAPWAAACGVRVPKLAGRGLGHTGGTIDKLEAIPGLSVALSVESFRAQVEAVGWAVAEARAIAPADKILYALRDATATVGSRPLIVASILSKKFAGGAPAFVFDVKSGAGALLPGAEEARALAAELVAAAAAGGRRAVALISDMNQPLGRAVGNALEVDEAVVTLRGEGPADLLELSRAVAAEMLVLGGVASAEEAGPRLAAALASGAAFAKLDEMARAQGAVRDWAAKLPRAKGHADVLAASAAYVNRLEPTTIARAAAVLGAARSKAGDALDPAAGVVLHKKAGDAVARGEPLASLHYNDDGGVAAARTLATAAFTLGEKPAARPLVKAVIRY